MKDLFKMARSLAKQLDTPEMRELYRKQKLADDTLDQRVDELSDELGNEADNEFNHDKDS